MITIKQERYSYTIDGPYDSVSTQYTARSIVTIGTLVKTFEDDLYLHKARTWINKTFAEEQYTDIQSEIKATKLEIEEKQKRVQALEQKVAVDFLVPVKLEK